MRMRFSVHTGVVGIIATKRQPPTTSATASRLIVNAPQPRAQWEGFLPTSQAVIQYLPYLRRYARALSGSQASGDAYVAAALEALVGDPKVLDTTASTRIALYRLFTKIWNSVALNSLIHISEPT